MFMNPTKWFLLAWPVLLLSFACSSDQDVEPEPEPTVWTRLAHKPGQAIRGAAGFSIGDSGYVVSGFYGNELYTTEVYRYDTGSSTWLRMADVPLPMVDATGFAIGGKGYVFGGFRAEGRLKELWEYDPVPDRWTRKADLPAEPRILAPVLVLGGQAYLVGGGGVDVKYLDVWRYDPAQDSWTPMSDFPGAGSNSSASFVIGDRGYICCGISSASGWAVHRELWMYEPGLDRWTRKADFGGVARGYAQGVTLEGKGYVGLGTATNTAPMSLPRELWCYDPAADTWTRQPELPASGRAMFTSFSVGDVGYFGLGGDMYNNDQKDFWCLAVTNR